MNDTIPPLAQKLVDFLRGIDTRYAAHEYLVQKTARMIDEHVPIKSLESELNQFRYENQWYPADEVIPDRGKPVLVGWIKRNGEETLRVAVWWGLSRGWRLSGSDVSPRTPPDYWRELPTIKRRPSSTADGTDKASHESNG
ncbi:hypothetical protein OPIT5_03940 [Opitutaceae bacterium TAV5]|nr:hypothetical protein OPIT5_03940 [Opitutaceae bacterium TAV5]